MAEERKQFSRDGENAAKQTNVRGENFDVSRETFSHGGGERLIIKGVPKNKSRPPADESERLERQLARKAKGDGMRRVGGIADNNPYDFDNPGLKELYKSFRSNGLSRLESLYNAVYLRCSDNYYSSGVGVKKKYENIYLHPMSWFSNATTMWRHNKWSVALKLLEIPVSLSKVRRKTGEALKTAGGNLARGAETSGKVGRSAKSLLTVMLLGAAAAIGVLWWNEASVNMAKLPVLKLYIDGEHVGNVRTIDEVALAKRTVESSISMSLGLNYAMECVFDYEASRAKRSDVLNEAKLNKVLHEAAHEEMEHGFCLYKGDLPVCAVEDKRLLDYCLNESIKLRFPELVADDNVQNIGYKDFIIRQGAFPQSLFVDASALRALLSLPPINDDGTAAKVSADANLYVDNALITDGYTAGMSSGIATEGLPSALSVTMEAVVTRTETVTEIMPYDTEYIYDDDLPEGLTSSVSAGRNGVRKATYAVTYTDGKETARRLLSEEAVTQPVKAVKKLGTRPLTEEEKQYKSTGTYIYPSKGEISSAYGWRLLGGHNEFHKGLDMRSDMGLDLVASDGGTVIQAKDRGDGYGRCILIQHDDGTITRYAHCSELLVAEMQKVKQGQLIAKMGSTGYVTGVHIHFEIIKNGKVVDPMDYLMARN